jgi:hypothetical protein
LAFIFGPFPTAGRDVAIAIQHTAVGNGERAKTAWRRSPFRDDARRAPVSFTTS